MKHTKRFGKLFWSICLVLMMSMIVILPAQALTKSGNVSDGTSVKITKANTVVDSITVNGVTVNALYKPKKGIVSSYNSDSTYCCAAFVKRFYSQVYGVSVNNLIPGRTPNVLSGGGKFVKTTTPKVGDIYATSGHWAIVKSVSGNKVTLVEQNYWWNVNSGLAGKGRIVPLSGTSHWYFTWTGTSVPVTKVALNKSAATLYTGKTLTLKATITPSNASVKTITWTSSNTAVATVSSSGVVTAKGPGIATITAKSNNGKTAVCKITVPFNTSVSVKAVNLDAGIKLTYTNVASESGYKIYRKEGSGKYSLIATTGANVTTYVDTKATPGKTYTYVVYPYRGTYLGSGGSRTILRLSTPVITSVKSVLLKRMTVTWNKSAGSPTAYKITCKTGNSTKSVTVKQCSRTCKNKQYSYTMSGLLYGKTYNVTVTAINGSYSSNASVAKSVKINK